LFLRATASLEAGDLAAAERDLEAAIAADPALADAHHNLGVVYVKEERWPEAEASYRKALELQPDSWLTRENLSRLLVALGRTDEAVAEAQRVVAAADTASGRLLLARAYVADGRIAQGCEEFQRALNFNPRNSAVQLELAVCHAANDDLDAASLHAGAVTGRDPRNAEALALVEHIRVRRRALTWWWAPVVVFIASACAALGARRPDQWGQRRVAIGLLAMSAAAFVWLQQGSLFWLTGGSWGVYQFYAAHRFRRAHALRAGQRTEYLGSAATILGCIALSDGPLQPMELKIVRETYEKAGYTDADLLLVGGTLQRCAADFQATLFEHQALYAALHNACITFASVSNEASRLELFRTAVRVALADQHATPGELSAVKACATWLNIPDTEQDAIWRDVTARLS
jgi:Tfp pilus assembly protein PilF